MGLVLSAGGAAVAFVALRLLRAESCPACRAVGSLVVLRLLTDDRAGLGPGEIRYRRCGECGTVLKDLEPVERTFDHPRLSAPTHHLMR